MVEAAGEAGDLGERRGVGFAQLGGGGNVVKVGDGGPGALHVFRDCVEFADYLVVRTARPGTQFLDAPPRPREGFRHRGAHVAGFDAVEGDRERSGEEGVGVVAQGKHGAVEEWLGCRAATFAAGGRGRTGWPTAGSW